MTDVVLVDTDVVSFFFKNDSRAGQFAPLLAGKRQAIAFMTSAELWRWGLKRGWGQPRLDRLEELIRSFLVLPADAGTCRTWARVQVGCEGIGRPISVQDAWIAAIALQHGLQLATHNVSHFEAVQGLELLVPTRAS